MGLYFRDSVSHMFVSNIIDTFDACVRKSYFRFRESVLASTNGIKHVFNNNLSITRIINKYLWYK